MPLQIYITDLKQLDIEKYCHLQKAAFAEVLEKSGVDDSFLNPAFFFWKYNPPAGSARIAIAEENGKLLASVAMYPVNFMYERKVVQGWHFVEAAVLPVARGRRLFHECMSILIKSIENDELIYVFPNTNSLRATGKIGFELKGTIPFYAGFSWRKKTERKTDEVSIFSIAQDIYAKELIATKGPGIYRNSDYMNWRYIQHPHAKYYCYSAIEAGKVGGNVVIRSIRVKGVRMLLLMEAHAKDKVSAGKINLFIREVAATEHCSLIGMFANKPMKFGSTCNLIRIPSFLLPKKQVLMHYIKQPVIDDIWFIQTGDWDAF